MQRFKYVVLITLAVLATLAISGQNAGTAQPGTTAGQNALRVLMPKPGEKLRQNFVTVQLELSNAGASAAGLPNFRLRLDNRDPVTTNAAEYTFTGLTAGSHTIDVQLVDANDTPVAGAHSVVEFVTVPTGPTSRLRQRSVHPRLIQTALRVDGGASNPAPDDGQELPSAGGALPLLSVIGFGVLLGGIASAMRTR
jgi:hypothetical protein